MKVSRKELADTLRSNKKTFTRKYKKGVKVEGYSKKGRPSIVVTTFKGGNKKVVLTAYAASNKRRTKRRTKKRY